jgi:hypothetical protein
VHAQDLQTPVGTTGFGSLLCHLSNGRKRVKCKRSGTVQTNSGAII